MAKKKTKILLKTEALSKALQEKRDQLAKIRDSMRDMLEEHEQACNDATDAVHDIESAIDKLSELQ